MQIVTDSGVDLSPQQREGLSLHVIPLTITLDGKSYRSGVDIETDAFYDLLESTESLPFTSQPAPGEFAAYYRELAAEDPDILSIHMSSGLSGTFNAASEGAKMVPEANITLVDTLTLSGAAGWQVEAAARALQAGRPLDEILAIMQRISDATETLYTLLDLKYLIHGGRISHMKGLIASILNIKPVIGVSHEDGKYVQRGQARTFKSAVRKLGDLVEEQHGAGAALRVQVMHAQYPEGADILAAELQERFDCDMLPRGRVSTVLTAHTGYSLVGAAYAPQSVFADLP